MCASGHRCRVSVPVQIRTQRTADCSGILLVCPSRAWAASVTIHIVAFPRPTSAVGWARALFVRIADL
eukprot:1728100-Rhodomonas_salina.3